jgi:cytochrome c-type biogenesis protein CcmE
MKNKYVLGGIIILLFFVVMGYLFTQTNVKYENNFQKVINSSRTVKVTGSWDKEKSYKLDTQNNKFIFFLKNEKGDEMKVVYDGTIPNNFDHATSVVVTGKYKNGVFKAKEILTKCPSKYQDTDNSKQKNS